MKAQIDLNENSVYIVKDKKLTKVTAINHGTDEFIWQDGKVLDIKREERIRIDGQKVI